MAGVRKEKGPEGENGSRQYNRQADDGSDGDELGDSDSERGEVDQTTQKGRPATTTTATTTTTKTPRGRGRPSAASQQARVAAASSTTTSATNRASSLAETTRSPYSVSNSAFDKTTFSSKMPASPSLPGERPSAPDPSKLSRSIIPAQGSSKDTPRTTAGSSSGSSAPYYYNSQSSSAAPSQAPGHSPRDAHFKNRVAPFTSMTGSSSAKTEAAPTTTVQSSSSNNAEDLTMHEVDKFLDLIEKHNLHTSNEDDMARSVTELYQEWLEWCAKRSVQSTKSKQALVAEFVRIHQGEYGRLRQQRAMDVVKGSAGGMQEGDRNPLTTDLPSQTSATYLPPSRSAPSVSHSSRLKEEELDGVPQPKSLSASIGAKRVPSGSGYIHVPSPSIAPRALTPGPSSSVYDSHAQSEALYHRVREEIWKDATVMIERVVHEQMAVVLEKNNALRGRVEQLEIHSDNLAQWIQHLNRVQDDLTQSIQSAPPAPPMREEVIAMEDKYSRHHPVEQRTYAPSYHIGATSTKSSSPRRSYAVRRSPSPPIITHHSSIVPSSRRPIGSPHRDQQPRDSRDYHPSNAGQQIDSSFDRSTYYTYPQDDRDHHAPSLPSRSPHLAKRARNGY